MDEPDSHGGPPHERPPHGGPPHERPPHGRPHDGPKKEGGGKLKELLKADLDQDGVISFTEFSTMERLAPLDDLKRRKLYDFLDKNNDGELQSDEVTPKEPHWVSSVKRNFSQIDKDASSDLSFEEFSKMPVLPECKSEMLKRLFGELDEDGDGLVTLANITEHRRSDFKKPINFTKFDLNESGGLDKAEYLKLPMINKIPKEHVEELFTRIDNNEDGELSTEEFKQHHERRRGGHRPPQPH